MNRYEKISIAAFGREAMNEIWAIYNARTGGYENVDRAAAKRVLDRFPDATDEEKDALETWAALGTR